MSRATLRPFFTFFGGKWRTALRYPDPEHRTIVEPFAGSAGYALRHYTHKVVLVEKSVTVADLWGYLINVPADEIRSLPVEISDLRDMNLLPEQKSLIGFWLNKGSVHPGNVPSRWMRDRIRPNSFWGPVIRERIALQVDAIRHWEVLCGDYSMSPDCSATWFVDPPYQRSGLLYRESSASINFSELASWCEMRKGQAIVCEQQGADWLPFLPFYNAKATEGARGAKRSLEVIWTNRNQN